MKMNERRYLLTHDEICRLQDISLLIMHYDNVGDGEYRDRLLDTYNRFLEEHRVNSDNANYTYYWIHGEDDDG